MKTLGALPEARRPGGDAHARLLGGHFAEGAGHWVQQEKPAEVSRLLFEFLRRLPD